MTTLDELERSVERLNRAVERLSGGMGKYGFANVYNDDVQLLLSERAELLATVERMRKKTAESADVKPTDGDLWWNPGNDEDGFSHWADAFENANGDRVDYSVELYRARRLPPVWGALLWIDGEQKVKVFATEAEADEARAVLTTGENK